MAELTEGTWNCKVLGAEANANDKDIVVVRIKVRITDGPDSGRLAIYEEEVNFRGAKYIAKSAKACGWRGIGRLEETLATDVAEWIAKTGGDSTLEVVHLEIKNGKRAGQMWGKIRNIGSGPRPLKTPSRTASDEAAEAMAAAMNEEAGTSGPDDNKPNGTDDDIPF